MSASQTLEWIIEQIEGDAIEDVNDEMLQKLVSGDLTGSGFCECNLHWTVYSIVFGQLVSSLYLVRLKLCFNFQTLI